MGLNFTEHIQKHNRKGQVPYVTSLKTVGARRFELPTP